MELSFDNRAQISGANRLVYGESMSDEEKLKILTTPRINLELLEQVQEKIELAVANQLASDWLAGKTVNPTDLLDKKSYDGWNQGDWRVFVDEEGNIIYDDEDTRSDIYNANYGTECGTAMCVAGWAGQVISDNTDEYGWVVPIRPGEHGVPENARIVDVKNSYDYHIYGNVMFASRSEIDNALAREITLVISYVDDDDDGGGKTPEVKTIVKKVHTVGVEDRAVRTIGLTYQESERLFNGDNNLLKVRGLITTLINEEKARRLYQQRAKERAAQEKNAAPKD